MIQATTPPLDSKKEDDVFIDALPELDHGRSVEDRALALRLATEQDPGLATGSPRMIRFCLIALVMCMCSGDNGFDGTVMSSVYSMTQFSDKFGAERVKHQTNVVFGLMTVGGVAGFIPSVLLPDWLGRRWAMFICNLGIVLGALLSTFAQTFAMFVAGRFVIGFAAVGAANAAKSYLAEITPPTSRGFWLGLNNTFWYVGSILASGIAIPFGRMLGTDWSWRAPMLIQLVPAVINIAFVMFMPESPRWLFARGKEEEARRILARYHSHTDDINSPLVKLEIEEMTESISLDGSDRRWWDFSQVFNGRSNIYRAFLCAIVSVWGQVSGNGLISYFFPTVLKISGIVSGDRQRILLLVSTCLSFVGAMTGASIVDFVGRRTLMLFSETAAAVLLAISGGLLASVDGQPHRAGAGVAFLMMFSIFFSVGWTPLQGLYPPEVLTYENRMKGLSLQGLLGWAVSMINTWALPPALETIGYKTYFIFVAWDLIGVVVIYFFVVETKRLTLEQLDDVFASKNPRLRSTALVKEAKLRAAEMHQADSA